MKLYIGENLKRLRNEKSVTQDTLAEYLGVTYQAVSRWENGQAYPDIELLPELARFFEVSLEELMGTESNRDRIDKTFNECWALLEADKGAEALAKLHELEKEYPNDWYIKNEICYFLFAQCDPPFDNILPELRRYAFRAREDMKDYHYKMTIAEFMIEAVPEEELSEWTGYVSNSLWSTRDRALYNRYLSWKQWDKAAEKESEILIKYTEFLTHFHNHTGTAEGNIAPSSCGLRLIEALVGTPYCKGDH
ncbi:MAG: helix-turn-helix transcriptional regulator, partial [Clostridia bacterium]|nr:helix-turn-helix transcriptional regulator [Clostridia bacterium]